MFVGSQAAGGKTDRINSSQAGKIGEPSALYLRVRTGRELIDLCLHSLFHHPNGCSTRKNTLPKCCSGCSMIRVGAVMLGMTIALGG
jgi:hypothetical protein